MVFRHGSKKSRRFLWESWIYWSFMIREMIGFWKLKFDSMNPGGKTTQESYKLDRFPTFLTDEFRQHWRTVTKAIGIIGSIRTNWYRYFVQNQIWSLDRQDPKLPYYRKVSIYNTCLKNWVFALYGRAYLWFSKALFASFRTLRPTFNCETSRQIFFPASNYVRYLSRNQSDRIGN